MSYKPMTACVSSARSEVQVIYVKYENYYIQWLLLGLVHTAG